MQLPWFPQMSCVPRCGSGHVVRSCLGRVHLEGTRERERFASPEKALEMLPTAFRSSLVSNCPPGPRRFLPRCSRHVSDSHLSEFLSVPAPQDDGLDALPMTGFHDGIGGFFSSLFSILGFVPPRSTSRGCVHGC